MIFFFVCEQEPNGRKPSATACASEGRNSLIGRGSRGDVEGDYQTRGLRYSTIATVVVVAAVVFFSSKPVSISAQYSILGV